jgi:hypothetical protein
LPSVVATARRSPACTQDRRVEQRWPCSARSAVRPFTRNIQSGEQMLTRIGGLVGLVMAWRRHRRARQAADPLLSPDPNGRQHAPPSPITTRSGTPASRRRWPGWSRRALVAGPAISGRDFSDATSMHAPPREGFRFSAGCYVFGSVRHGSPESPPPCSAGVQADLSFRVIRVRSARCGLVRQNAGRIVQLGEGLATWI